MIFMMFVALLFLAAFVSGRRGIRVCPLEVNWPGSNCFSGTRSNALEARVLGCADKCAVLVRHWVFSPGGEQFNETMLVGSKEVSYPMRRRGIYLESPILLIVLDRGEFVKVGDKGLKVPCAQAKVPDVIEVDGLSEGSGLKLDGLILVYTKRPGKLECGDVKLTFKGGLIVGWKGCQVVRGGEEIPLESLMKQPLCRG